jgi:hypothetical protein
MAYSREALVLLALEELGVPGAGQTPSAEDKATIDNKLNSVMDDLALRNIYTWGDPDETPDAAAIHLAVIMAQASARSFGQMADEGRRLMAEARLTALRQTILSGQPQQVEWY